MTGVLIGITAASAVVAFFAIRYGRKKTAETKAIKAAEAERIEKLRAVLEHRSDDREAAETGRKILIDMAEAKDEKTARDIYLRGVDLYNRL